MKKMIFIIIIIICNSFSTLALPDYPVKKDSIEQTRTVKKTNLIYGEVGGNGLLLSMNYERYFTKNLSFRVGFGTRIYDGLTYPLLINYSFEIPIEIGVGIIPYSHIGISEFFENHSSILITSTFGFKRINKGFIFKISITPFFNPDNSKLKLLGGISLGIAF